MEPATPRLTVIVVGGGPAGLMAAGTAAASGARVLLLEKNAQCGRKLLLTGSGKCNLTNQAPLARFLERYPENGKFLYPAFRRFFREDLESFFNERGLALETEENGKIFPAVKSAESVLSVLLACCAENGVEFHAAEPVVSLRRREPSGFLVATPVRAYEADRVILATGGLSYPKTGSTGDGYALAASLSHTVVPTRPALVALETSDSWTRPLSGVSLKNVRLFLWEKTADKTRRRLAQQDGDLLFTHFGVSGPPVLLLSRWLPDAFETQGAMRSFLLSVDLFPLIPAQQLDEQLLEQFAQMPLGQVKTVLNKQFALPLSAAALLMERLGFGRDATIRDMTKEKRRLLLASLKDLELPLKRTRGYAEAMTTAGGISIKEIRPQTMESLRVPHLYFAGECIDIDGDTGGFSLQAAFSTGFLAGQSASQ